MFLQPEGRDAAGRKSSPTAFEQNMLLGYGRWLETLRLTTAFLLSWGNLNTSRSGEEFWEPLGEGSILKLGQQPALWPLFPLTTSLSDDLEGNLRQKVMSVPNASVPRLRTGLPFEEFPTHSQVAALRILRPDLPSQLRSNSVCGSFPPRPPLHTSLCRSSWGAATRGVPLSHLLCCL